MARIEVRRRAGGYTDRARSYKVKVDGEEKGKVGAGEGLSVEVPAGQHDVYLQVDWAKSPPLTVDAADVKAVKLYCEPNASPLTALWYAIFARNRYILLEEDTGQ